MSRRGSLRRRFEGFQFRGRGLYIRTGVSFVWVILYMFLGFRGAFGQDCWKCGAIPRDLSSSHIRFAIYLTTLEAIAAKEETAALVPALP